MPIRFYPLFVLIGTSALIGCNSCIFDSCRECLVPVRATAFAQSLRDTTLRVGGDLLVLYALGGQTPLFEVVGEGEPDFWRLRAQNVPPDSGVFRYELVTDDEVYGLDAEDRVVIEALKPGNDDMYIEAQPVDPDDCGIAGVHFIVHVAE